MQKNHWTNRGKCIVLFSGGLDSTVALYLATNSLGTENVMALNCYYGQQHDIEMQMAQQTCEALGVQYRAFNLREVYTNCGATLLANNAKVAHGDYASQVKDARANDKSHLDTTIPFRNGLMLSAAVTIAQSEGYATVMYGAHKDDAGAMYADCSPEFFRAMFKAVEYGTAGEVNLAAPFLHMTKDRIVTMGLNLNVPFERTWSCYDPQIAEEHGSFDDTVPEFVPCGKCGTCIDRAKAFEKNEIEDPLTSI